ncbi:sporulation inhibitor of replication protein SirA [Chungangia koreensis]|uniref:Sporulation inhibitor of replication protein SirA n=1 Tax=Chungangia koreensis TaxID=752657 RepID=A0ABV8X657_9LACT
MRTYSIFEIKSDYQPFIIGREHLLFELLNGKGTLKVGTSSREIDYLCEPIDPTLIDQAIMQKMGNLFPSIIKKTGSFELSHPIKGDITIEIHPLHLEATCNGSRMLDLDLFVSLSNVSSSFFAVMDDEHECGWLKPVKSEQVSMQYMREVRTV